MTIKEYEFKGPWGKTLFFCVKELPSGVINIYLDDEHFDEAESLADANQIILNYLDGNI